MAAAKSTFEQEDPQSRVMLAFRDILQVISEPPRYQHVGLQMLDVAFIEDRTAQVRAFAQSRNGVGNSLA